MKTAIIIHGMPDKEEYFDPTVDSESNCHWLPWIQKKLLDRHVLAQTPEMPDPYEPNYEKWKSVFEQFHLDQETILIGHSCGGGFLVRWLSEHEVKVGQVLLVAPWIDAEKELSTGFFDFDIDPTLGAKTKEGIVVFYSIDDDKDILKSVDKIKATIHDIQVREFTDKRHFTLRHMGTNEFPELLGEIK